MIRNIISYVIPFAGLLGLMFTFYFLDKNVAPTKDEPENSLE
ncbi:hypothetical protein [Calidifontibacillus erzurumensis]|nr:hypothetical protein [Calidifontibacillus erzurumensis]